VRKSAAQAVIAVRFHWSRNSAKGLSRVLRAWPAAQQHSTQSVSEESDEYTCPGLKTIEGPHLMRVTNSPCFYQTNKNYGQPRLLLYNKS
jgi:hypothetical protein